MPRSPVPQSKREKQQEYETLKAAQDKRRAEHEKRLAAQKDTESLPIAGQGISVMANLTGMDLQTLLFEGLNVSTIRVSADLGDWYKQGRKLSEHYEDAVKLATQGADLTHEIKRIDELENCIRKYERAALEKRKRTQQVRSCWYG